MKFVQLNFGGTITIDLPVVPDSGTVTGSVFSPAGAELGSASVAVQTFSTTTTAAANPGVLQLTLSSSAGAVLGQQYLLDGPEALGGETVTLKAISGSTATLLRPTLSAHPVGASFQSSRATFTIPAAYAASVGRHYRLKVDCTSEAVEQPSIFVTFDVTRYNPVSFLNAESLRDLDPTLAAKIKVGTSLAQLKERTWSMILARIAQNYSPGSLVGSIDLTTAHQYLIRSELALIAGAEFQDYRDKLAQRFQEEFEASLGAAAFDNNQDGALASNEGYLQSIYLSRG